MWTRPRTSVATVIVTLVVVVGFTTAPAAATTGLSDGDGATTTAAAEDVPEEFCTDVPETVHGEVPYDDVPWFSDLPSEYQPPGVPWSVVTPRAVAGIVAGVTPNQCDVFDPSDPPFDPTDPPRNPDADVDGGADEDLESFVILYHVTLEEGEEGPGSTSQVAVLVTGEEGEVDPEAAVHDGEKPYEIDPYATMGDDGTGEAFVDAHLFGTRGGAGVVCDGEECTVVPRGLPQEDIPAIPAPTGDGESNDSPDDGTDDTDDDTGTDDGGVGDGTSESSDAGSGADGGASSDGGGGGTAADPSGDGASDDAGDGDSTSDDPRDGNAGDGDGGDGAGSADDGAPAEADDGATGQQYVTPSEAAGPGFGGALAVLTILAAGLLAARRR